MCTPETQSASVAISVVIVSWNVCDLLDKCLASLKRYSSVLSYEVLVVDNASTDGTAEMIRQSHSDVLLIENCENVGFSRGNNQGIERARGRYVLLLNPDTLCLDDSLARLVAFIDGHQDVGAVGPRLLNPDGSIQFEGARRLPLPFDTFCEYTRLSALFPSSLWPRRHLMAEWDHQDSRPVACLSGACLLIRREALDDVGGLDEGYPFNVEDIDWCHRASKKRWTLHYVADAQIVHIGRQSIMKNRGAAALGAMRGVYRYYSKFHGRPAQCAAWALLWPVSLMKLLVWTVIFVIRRKDRALALEQVRTFWMICCLSPWPT